MESVISCSKSKEWKSPKTGQNVPIYAIGLSDGRGGESFGKEIPVGTPVSELIIEDTGQYGLKFKLKNAGGFGGGFKQRGGNESFALSYAKDLVVAGKVDLKNILPTADKFYAWLEGKKAPSIAPPAAPSVAPSKEADNDLPF